MTRSQPLRVKMDCWIAISSGLPRKRRPPISEYSPSLFSRTTSMSMSAGPRPASGDLTPFNSRTGRRLMYWWNSRRMGISRPQSDTWSGTPGKPTAPRKIDSKGRSCAMPSSGIIRPVFA
jgi:hypothetical protein